MKTIQYIYIIITFVAFSCIDDNSKFGGNEIDEIQIEGIKTSYEIEIGAALKINPEISTKFGNNSELEYIWYKYNAQQTVPDTLSSEKNLDVEIKDVLPGVETTLVLKVIDKKTGVYAKKNTIFTTIGVYSGGTLMLCRTGDEYELALLKRDGTTIYEDLYSVSNEGEKLSNKSKKIILTTTYNPNPLGHKAIIVTADDATGGVYLDPDILKRRDFMKDKFTIPLETNNITISAYCNDQGADYLIVNGQLHSREMTWSGEKVNWLPAIVNLSEPKDYFAAPFTSHPTGYPMYALPVVYDNINNRFMFCRNSGYFSFFLGDHDFTAFNPNEMGNGVELIASGSLNSTLNQVWALMKNNNNNEYFVITYRFQFNSDWTYNFISESKKVLANTSYPEFYTASKFTPGTKARTLTSSPFSMDATGLSDICFFISDNKVYAFNMNTLSGGAIIDGNIENFEITGIDCTEMNSLENPDETYIQFTVAVKDNSLSSKKAGIVVYSIRSLGGVSAQKMYSKTGICDEIIFTIEKNT